MADGGHRYTLHRHRPIQRCLLIPWRHIVLFAGAHDIGLHGSLSGLFHHFRQGDHAPGGVDRIYAEIEPQEQILCHVCVHLLVHMCRRVRHYSGRRLDQQPRLHFKRDRECSPEMSRQVHERQPRNQHSG